MHPFNSTIPTRPYGWIDQPQHSPRHSSRILPNPAMVRHDRDSSFFENQYPSGYNQRSSLRRKSAPFESERYVEENYIPSSSNPSNLPLSPYPIELSYSLPPPYATSSHHRQSSYHSKDSYLSSKESYGVRNSNNLHPSSGSYAENRVEASDHETAWRRNSTPPLYASQSPHRSPSPYRSNSPYRNAAHENDDYYNTQQPSPTIQRKGIPTVYPAPDFNPVKDVHDLRAAMKGCGTDEGTLINIICHRSNTQRQEIRHKYKTFYGKELIDDIKSETSGNFQRVLVGLLLPLVEFYVKELSDAMAGLGTDEDVLVEILCTLSNAEIRSIKRAYRKVHGWTLEAELKSETSGSFKRLLVSLCEAGRDESGKVDSIAAFNDARDLLNAGELRFGTDGSTFNKILCERNFQQLRLVFQQYEHITGHTLEKAIKREFSGDIKDGLLAIYKCVLNRTEFFASRLHKSMAGLGTNNKQLIRIIITRSEVDLKDIKMEFENLYGKTLKNWIKGDISGDYKHALYALIDEQRSFQ